ncbi:MAG: hypothetical protein LBG06_00215 [Deltaproteobacteria bacterium]|jgi:hypothetical protein|nr:hypothetical protein [Deltaproteobacteria bacterium]
MARDYIYTDECDSEIFKKVMSLRDTARWADIDRFMGMEYGMKWINGSGNLHPYRHRYQSGGNIAAVCGSGSVDTDRACRRAVFRYLAGNRLRDMNEILVIYERDKGRLPDSTVNLMTDAFCIKGIDHAE